MTAERFRKLQAGAALTNAEAAALLCKSEATIEKWRSGERGISASMARLVELLFMPLIQENIDAMQKMTK